MAVPDEVRSGTGETSFRLAVAPGNAGAVLRRVSDQARPHQRAEVFVDGASVGVRSQPLSNPDFRWLEDAFPLPESATSGTQVVTVTIRPAPDSLLWMVERYFVDSVVAPGPDSGPPAAPAGVGYTGKREHSLRVMGRPAAHDVGTDHYRVYGATTPDVPISPDTLLGETRLTTFLHRAAGSGRTWYHRVVAVDAAGNAGPPSAAVSARTAVPADSDLDGDGRDDAVTFTRGPSADVYVSLSDGTRFVQDGWRWRQGFPAGDGARPGLGDVDGDGREDLVSFAGGRVTVALSAGSSFGGASRWHEHFAVADEIPGIGDFDGDGRADVVTFTRGAEGKVYVSLSDGRRFVQDAWQWHGHFAPGDEVPRPSLF